jgi:hypothetical protein
MRVLLALCGAAAALPAAAQPASAPSTYPAEMSQAQSDYVEHCGGCHGIHGIAAPADLPTLKDRVGWFTCLPQARAYLVRLPNIARSRITDNDQLADLLNFMLFGLGGRSTPAGTRPFTGAEVASARATPFTSVSLVETRAVLVEQMIRQCGAPAGLRLMYPGQTGRAPAGKAPRAAKNAG